MTTEVRLSIIKWWWGSYEVPKDDPWFSAWLVCNSASNSIHIVRRTPTTLSAADATMSITIQGLYEMTVQLISCTLLITSDMFLYNLSDLFSAFWHSISADGVLNGCKHYRWFGSTMVPAL